LLGAEVSCLDSRGQAAAERRITSAIYLIARFAIPMVKSSSSLMAQPDDQKQFIVSAENLRTFLELERQASKSVQNRSQSTSTEG